MVEQREPVRLLMTDRNIRLLMLGRLVSDFGSSVFFISIIWEAAARYGGASTVGLALAAFAIPSAFLAPIAGVCADRLNKKHLIVGSDLASGGILIAFGMVGYVWVGGIEWLVATILLVQFAGVFFRPALLALIPELSSERTLTQANASVQFASTLANIVGLGVGGVLVAMLDLEIVLILDGVTFILSGVSEMYIRYAFPGALRTHAESHGITRLWPDVLGGFKLVWKSSLLRGLMLTEAAVNFVGCSIYVVLPLLVLGIGDGDPKGYGALQASMAVGSVLAAAVMSLLRQAKRGYVVLALAVVVAGIAITLMGVSSSLMLLSTFMACMGLAATVANVTETSIIQKASPSAGRGRVFALRGALDSALRPVAFWFFGVLAVAVRLRALLMFAGVLVGLGGVVYWLVGRQLRGEQVV